MKRATVLDAHGNALSPCPEQKARALVSAGKARLLSEAPLTIQLDYAVECVPQPLPDVTSGAGQRLLLHICCAPCATYTVKHLRAEGWEVTGYWHNPNIHPYSEHEKRREALVSLAGELGLPILWEPGYDLLAFLRAVVGHERFGERCALCYALRLERLARTAQAQGFAAFSTTLLISPYQDQAVLHRVGEALGARYGVAFHFENLRRGFAEHHRLAEHYGLYRQRYCGCLFSEWEALDRQTTTRVR